MDLGVCGDVKEGGADCYRGSFGTSEAIGAVLVCIWKAIAGLNGRVYIWRRVSDSASRCVRPCRRNDLSMSRRVFLSGPKRSATTLLAMLETDTN